MSIDTRTLRPGELFVAIRGERFDGAEFAGAALEARRGGRRRAARSRRPARLGARSGAVVVIEVDDTTRGAAGAGARGAARVGHEGRGDHRQRRQDDDEGSDGGVSRGAVPRRPQPGELEQPHRAAAVADRAAAAAGDGGRRTGHESRRGNQHAGRASPSRTCASGPTSARRTSGFFASLDAIADAKAEILEGADAVDAARRQRRRRRGSRRGIGAFRRPRRDVRDRSRRPTCAPRDVVDRGIDGTTRARRRRRAATFDLTTPLVGRGNLANVLAATAVARRVRRAARRRSPSGRARLRPAAHRGEVLRLRERRHAHRRQLQREPDGDASARSRCSAARRGASRRVAVLGEMLELGDRALGAARGRRPRGGGGRRRPAARRRRRAGAGAGRRGRRGGHAARRACATSRRATRRRTRPRALVQPGDLVLVKGSRGVRTDRVVDRLKAERG